ncbi:MAG: hypothetical protein GW867_29545 [Armatimonadetes bacterium]|nr:hypothetical protein [Armatimonadota bacterium]
MGETPSAREETAFARFAACCEALAATTKRTEKRRLLAAFLRKLPPDEVEATAQQVPAQLRLFDVLQVGDEPLIDAPYARRWERLAEIVGTVAVVERLVPSSPAEGERFFQQAVAEGHEGVMAKQLSSTYSPGARGGTVAVRPEVVVEVLFNDVQRSPQYACGRALRFARIARLRPDKGPEECDTLQTLRRLFAAQFGRERDSEGGAQ